MVEENMKKSGKSSKSIRSGSKHESYDGEMSDYSDSSGELQYGPGIVNRLKTKYLSMTVRENQKRGVRPPLSNLRRANSLENLLAAEKTETNNKSFIMSCAKQFESASESVTKSSRVPPAKPVMSRESMKRSCSVECLLKTFKDIVIEENNNSCVPQETAKVPTVKGATELPPPDVVKETLKIFEKCPGYVVVNKAKSSVTKPAISQKPNYLIEKSKFDCSNTKPKVRPRPIVVTQNLKNNNIEKTVRPNINSCQIQPLVPSTRSPNTHYEKYKHQNNVTKNTNVCTENVRKPVESPVSTSDCKSKTTKTESPVTITESKLKTTNSEPLTTISECKPITTKTELLKKDNIVVDDSTVKTKEIVEDSKTKNLTNPVESKTNDEFQKPVSNVALNNIRKSGTSVEFKFPSAKNNSHLPQDQNQVCQIGIVKPMPQPTKQQPTQQVINLPVDNTVNKIETNIISKNQVSQVVLSIKTKNANLWDSKPWHHQQNTMVFNFCDRKDVPDYIENDGLSLHNRSNSQGKRIFLTDSNHKIYLTELLGTVESSTDDIDKLASSIVFEGANVIQGKSNIQRNKKSCKMHIQFDLNTSVYEYPSEESFEESDIPDTPVKPAGPTLLNNTINAISPNNGVSTKLSSYQPSKLGINTNQFGMKPLNVNSKSVAPQPPTSNDEENLMTEDLLQRYSDHQTNGLLY